MRSVYVVGGDHGVTSMFSSRGWSIADDYDESVADLVCFTGGLDITPLLYGEFPIAETRCDLVRDKKEIRILKRLPDRLPKVGICRGAQLLNVLSGGGMYQHVNGHAIKGKHDVLDMMTGETIWCTSTHHQMMIPGDSCDLIGVAAEASLKVTDHGSITIPEATRKNNNDDTEVCFYKWNNSLCYQPHPEYVSKNDPCQQWFFSLIELWLFDK